MENRGCLSVAIVGVACQFSGANNQDDFWELLQAGRSGLGAVSKNRWDWKEFEDGKFKISTNQIGEISNIEFFDFEYFGLSREEAIRLDPQQKLVLQNTLFALNDANIKVSEIEGSNTAVYIGAAHSDHARALKKDYSTYSGDIGPNSYECFIANRVSYHFDLKGPSLVINAGCSSSLSAIYLACQSLRTKDSELAIAGGVNTNLLPDESISSSMANWLSGEGIVKSFSEGGDGYVKSDGCGLVVLKRLEDAISDGNKIYGVIRGGAINHNGLSSGLTMPNGLAQKDLIAKALNHANVSPAQIDYIEAHGGGGSFGDSNEAISIIESLSEGREEQHCYISSLKGNIGHAESSSGVASLMKVILSFRNEEIPKIANLKKLNRWIPKDKNFIFLEENKKIGLSDRFNISAVSCLSFSGANSFLILENFQNRCNAENNLDTRHCYPLLLSAKNKLKLKKQEMIVLSKFSTLEEIIGNYIYRDVYKEKSAKVFFPSCNRSISINERDLSFNIKSTDVFEFFSDHHFDEKSFLNDLSQWELTSKYFEEYKSVFFKSNLDFITNDQLNVNLFCFYYLREIGLKLKYFSLNDELYFVDGVKLKKLEKIDNDKLKESKKNNFSFSLSDVTTLAKGDFSEVISPASLYFTILICVTHLFDQKMEFEKIDIKSSVELPPYPAPSESDQCFFNYKKFKVE